MSDDRRDSLLDPNGGNEGVVEQRRLPVRDQAPVLHRPGVKVRQSYLVYRGEGIQHVVHQSPAMTVHSSVKFKACGPNPAHYVTVCGRPELNMCVVV